MAGGKVPEPGPAEVSLCVPRLNTHPAAEPRTRLPARQAAPMSRVGGAQGSAASSPTRSLSLFLRLCQAPRRRLALVPGDSVRRSADRGWTWERATFHLERAAGQVW
jgi:hypothetical protein